MKAMLLGECGRVERSQPRLVVDELLKQSEGMNTRRRFLGRLAATALGFPAVVASVGKPIRIGLVADAQYADVPPAGTRHYRRSPGKLGAAVEAMNSEPPDFCVHLGDLIDRGLENFETILRPLAGSRSRFHHVLGNHDFDVRPEEKRLVPGKMGMKSNYHAFDLPGWRFLFLDTTDVSLYAHPPGTPAHVEAARQLEACRAARLPQAQSWNSAVGNPQLDWLRRSCASASELGLRCLIFAHHPIAPDNPHNLWNAREMLQLLADQRCVIGWVNGHNHAGGIGEHRRIPCLTIQGMVETEDSNAYGVLELRKDRMILAGFGRVPSRELLFPSA